MRETLEALAAGPLAVLTNKPGDFSRTIVDGLGIGPASSRRVCGGGDVPAKKPDPVGLRRLIAEAGGDSRRGPTMVGDSAIDVATGRAAAVRTVGVTYGFDPEGLRARRPTC